MSQTALAQDSGTYPLPGNFSGSSRPPFALRAQDAPVLLGRGTMPRRGLRAYSVRDAARCVSVPDKLAQMLGRSRQLVDNWLPVSIPDGLAHAFGGGVSHEAGRALLRRHLAILCAWLDARLDEPPVVVENGPCRQVTVFGCVGYNIDYVSRQVRPVRIHANGARQSLSFEVELMRPLATAYWLNWVLEDLGLGANQAQLSLFGTPQEAHGHDEWLVRMAYRLLKNDPRFEGLRTLALPRALALSRDILALALHARHDDWAQGGVSTTTFNLVWEHEVAFRRIARENPQLLKLLELFLLENKLPQKADRVAEMRDYFRACGFNEAVWRYVHKYGGRLFRVAWKMATNKCRLEACVHYLRALEAAGLPPPPAPALATAWFRCFVNAQEDRLRFTDGWSRADPSVIRAVLVEGGGRRCAPGFAQYVGQAVDVLHWAMETELVLSPQQARAGWKWLRRRWLAWCARRAREANVGGVSWISCLPRAAIGRFEVVPIESGTGLIDEAIAMHNCVDDYVAKCKSGDTRVFSVRHAGSGRRVATLGIISIGDLWLPYQVKRSANRPASRELEQLMTQVAQAYTERFAAAP